MMLPPQLATVPAKAIEALCEWLGEKNPETAGNGPGRRNSSAPVSSNRLQLGGGLEEQAVRFGPDDRLFGIITSGPATGECTTPGVVLLCGGATHRISANRMYVTLARQLAANGTPVVRMDIAGIGDSPPHDGYPPNKPYTDRLADDVEAAMNLLGSTTGRDRFLLFGLCSGAFAAMQTAYHSARVSDLVLVNQLVYYASPRDLADLASGTIASAHDLDFPRSDSVLYRCVRKLLHRVSPYWSWPGELLSSYVIGGPLARDLDELAARGIRLAFVHSSRDDAVAALAITSGKRLQHLADSGMATLKTFGGTDHTFSPTASQDALTEWTVEYLAKLASNPKLASNRRTRDRI
jgi:alpha-beta hydrolase superfamily lysophospholipase